MTKEEILQMKSRSEYYASPIDDLIEEKIFGTSQRGVWAENYSYNLIDAFSVAEHLNKDWFFELHALPGDCSRNANPKWEARFWDAEPMISDGVGEITGLEEYRARASTPELAICRAALLCAFGFKSFHGDTFDLDIK